MSKIFSDGTKATSYHSIITARFSVQQAIIQSLKPGFQYNKLSLNHYSPVFSTTSYHSIIIVRLSVQQAIIQSLKFGFQYFSTLIYSPSSKDAAYNLPYFIKSLIVLHPLQNMQFYKISSWCFLQRMIND